MEIEIQLTPGPIAENISPPPSLGAVGAWLEFRGVVRKEENEQTISALEYEAYPDMAAREIRRILESLGVKFPCQAAKVIHRVGVIPVGETAIYVGVASPHRGEAIALLAEFMDQLKQDVPIWKRRALSINPIRDDMRSLTPAPKESETPHVVSCKSLDEALAEIRSHGQPLPAVRAPLAEAFGHILRETVCAPSDFPDGDRSTRDGYAILQNDASGIFQVVDTLHAADWKPRRLKPGEAVRMATGAALPCENLRVLMQEHVERDGDNIRITKREAALNLRQRGEDVKAGQPLVPAGARLDAGRLALLAAAGCAQPLVAPRLRVVHFTTGNEIVPPDQTPRPGQVRDSNSILIRGLLQKFPCDVVQAHLPEDFEVAKQLVSTFNFQPSTFNLLLISGGAGVGDKDFTRPLLEWLGFEIVFSQVNIRPGRPLIFGITGGASVLASQLVGSLAPPDRVRMAFGLPGNPLSHFVCFHLFVAAALAKLTGAEPEIFRRGRLAAKLDDPPCPRETLWPARRGPAGLHPLAWASSGDVTCLRETNALIWVPVNRGPIESGTEVEFLSTD
jgi:molybdopterin molybdotransferase